MTDSSTSNTFSRNAACVAGTHVLHFTAGFAGLVAVSVAPKTTLGLAAIGAGLLAAGNADRLDDWGQSTFGATKSTK
jgi:hypothetical protein